MNRVIVGLGSNIEPDKNIERAKKTLTRKYKVVAESSFRQTKSIGDIQQADFINGAILLETERDSEQLKVELTQIETELGRSQEHNHNEPRTIDLDIILWNETIMDQDFYKRDYLKQSVLELLPDLKY